MEITRPMHTLYITGAGVSAESGIPTFRGEDGFWTIGSENYTSQEMATRNMYHNNPVEFLRWYHHRFATYRHHGPNDVHYWLSDKNLITQNIDGLDGKAGNHNYIAIHGRLDQMTLYHDQENSRRISPVSTPWDQVDESNLDQSLFSIFNINGNRNAEINGNHNNQHSVKHRPIINESYKPYVLLFDEYYTELYRISEAQQRMIEAERIIFMGTSFSVNITQMALEIAINQNIPIEVVDPHPINIPHPNVTYHKMKASKYIQLANH